MMLCSTSMQNTENKPEADTRETLEMVSSVAVVFKPFEIKIRHDEDVKRGLTSSLLNMVDCRFPFYNVCVNYIYFNQCFLQSNDIICEEDA